MSVVPRSKPKVFYPVVQTMNVNNRCPVCDKLTVVSVSNGNSNCPPIYHLACMNKTVGVPVSKKRTVYPEVKPKAERPTDRSKCWSRKIHYVTREQAERWAKADGSRAYDCMDCDGYHLTTIKKVPKLKVYY